MKIQVEKNVGYVATFRLLRPEKKKAKKHLILYVPFHLVFTNFCENLHVGGKTPSHVSITIPVRRTDIRFSVFLNTFEPSFVTGSQNMGSLTVVWYRFRFRLKKMYLVLNLLQETQKRKLQY